MTTVRLSYAKGTGHTTSVYRVRAKQGRYFMPPRTRAEDANDIAVEYFFERIVLSGRSVRRRTFGGSS